MSVSSASLCISVIVGVH